MEKDKMIEKMVIDLNCVPRYAEMVYNLNYRQITEGSVVLTREEYERLKSDRKIKVVQHLDDEFTVEIPLCEYDEMLEQTRKEKAKEILDDIFSDTFSIGGGLYELTPKDKKTLYKKYGVEVKG